MTLGTRLFTLLCGEFVGRDEDGNRYYRNRKRLRGGRERRWVLYEGAAEASKVPGSWHGWLHHTTDTAPSADPGANVAGREAHRANPTGTGDAYRPPGHVLSGGRRDRATGDYEPWRPA